MQHYYFAGSLANVQYILWYIYMIHTIFFFVISDSPSSMVAIGNLFYTLAHLILLSTTGWKTYFNPLCLSSTADLYFSICFAMYCTPMKSVSSLFFGMARLSIWCMSVFVPVCLSWPAIQRLNKTLTDVAVNYNRRGKCNSNTFIN